MIGLDYPKSTGIPQLPAKLDTSRSSNPTPVRALGFGLAPGMRVELWDSRGSAESYVSNGCDVDALRFHLDDCPPLQTWTSGVDDVLPPCPAGSCSMLNYWPQRHWHGAGAKMIVFRLPHGALTQWAHAQGHHHFDGLNFAPSAGFFDPVLSNLAMAMHRPLTDHRAAAPLFTSMIFEAVLTEVVKRFGTPKSQIQRGGLAGWQMRAVERLVTGRIDNQVQLAELASVCSLSVSYFVKAFRVTTGATPHQWLIGRRVERARELLRLPTLSLCEVAATCGFADQSHFTRTFSRATGASPGAWRKQALREARGGGAGADHTRYVAQPSVA